MSNKMNVSREWSHEKVNRMMSRKRRNGKANIWWFNIIADGNVIFSNGHSQLDRIAEMDLWVERSVLPPFTAHYVEELHYHTDEPIDLPIYYETNFCYLIPKSARTKKSTLTQD